MSCYPHAWERLWLAFDGTRLDRVKVTKADLATMIACTERPMPAGLVIMSGVKLVTCDRDELFKLLARHGREPCAPAIDPKIGVHT